MINTLAACWRKTEVIFLSDFILLSALIVRADMTKREEKPERTIYAVFVVIWPFIFDYFLQIYNLFALGLLKPKQLPNKKRLTVKTNIQFIMYDY